MKCPVCEEVSNLKFCMKCWVSTIVGQDRTQPEALSVAPEDEVFTVPERHGYRVVALGGVKYAPKHEGCADCLKLIPTPAPHSAPDATPREANEVNVCGMHVVAFSENCDICNADRRAAAERSRVRKEALEACCTVVCNLCAQHIQFSKEADLPHYHNVGTDTDLDYRPCKAASVRSLLAKEGL